LGLLGYPPTETQTFSSDSKTTDISKGFIYEQRSAANRVRVGGEVKGGIIGAPFKIIENKREVVKE
jgi:hypothetical protein